MPPRLNDPTREVTLDDRSADADRMRDRLRRKLFAEQPSNRAGEAAEDSFRAFLGSVPEMEDHRSEEQIARGGMGTVELVHDRQLRRAAAMKIVRAEMSDEAWVNRAFLMEAQLTAQLEHPNIVPVHRVGRLDDGRLCFTMKHVRGRDLATIIDELEDGPLSRAELFGLLDVVVKICDALALAHSRNVVHCDIKPSNVMVGDYGEVYLMDWGISRLVSGGRGISTSVRPAEPQGPFGTISYMPPEQARGDSGATDARSDVFGVGALLYTMIARRPPYLGKTSTIALMAAEACEFPPLPNVAPGGEVPPALARIVARAMARDPGDRYQSIGELRGALVEFMRGERSFPGHVFMPGEYIVREGEPAASGYIIVSGRCEVRKTERGEEIALHRMGPGDVFGETALLTRAPRTASVVALEETTVHVVTRETFEEAMASMPPWMSAFVRSLAERFRERETGRSDPSA